MSDTVPNERLGKYFGIRNLFVGISSLLSVIIAGVVLNKTASFNHPILGFSIIFAAAFISAYTATNYQSKMIDPNPKIKQDSKHSFKEFITTIKENNFGRYTWFFATFQMFVYIASPFYAIYMLKVLNFDYLTYTIVSTAASVSALGSMKIWGKLVDKYGSKKIMSITAFIIPFSPILWMITTNWKALAVIEAVSGIVWAGFNLSCSTFMFESVKPEHKVKLYTYNKVLYGVGVFLGVMIGILLINIPPIFFSSSILLIFFTSGALRFITALIFIPRIEEEKVITINFKTGPFFKQIITIRPKEGASFRVGGSHELPKLDAKFIQQKKKQAENKKDKMQKPLNKETKSIENQKKDKTQKQINITRDKNEKKDRNTQKGNPGASQSVAGDKPRIYNNPLKPIRK
jgi:MFS family permease